MLSVIAQAPLSYRRTSVQAILCQLRRPESARASAQAGDELRGRA